MKTLIISNRLTLFLQIERKGKSFFDSELGESSAWTADHEESSSSGGGTFTKTSSSSSWSSSSSSGSRAHLSKEERRRFEEEERRREEEAAARETGDGSHRHIERAKARVQGEMVIQISNTFVQYTVNGSLLNNLGQYVASKITAEADSLRGWERLGDSLLKKEKFWVVYYRTMFS